MGRVSTNINTYNESSLHNTLKVFYAEKFGGETEVEAEGHIYDILCGNGDVIEIQTKNLSKLAGKIKNAMVNGIFRLGMLMEQN